MSIISEYKEIREEVAKQRAMIAARIDENRKTMSGMLDKELFSLYEEEVLMKEEDAKLAYEAQSSVIDTFYVGILEVLIEWQNDDRISDEDFQEVEALYNKLCRHALKLGRFKGPRLKAVPCA